MQKGPLPIAPDVRPDPSRWSLLRSGTLILLGIALAPLLAEGASLCYAQWYEVMGTTTKAHTPIIDMAQEHLETAAHWLGYNISAYFMRAPWNPAFVFPIAFILMCVGMAMLKR